MTYVPEQGDIVLLDFDPSSGKEIMKRRPALVISRKIFNDHTDFAIVAPITSTIRDIKLEVALPDNLSTRGTILVYQLKSIDYVHRNAGFVEKAPPDVVEKVVEIAQVIIR